MVRRRRWIATEHYMLYRRNTGSTTCGSIPEATVIRVPLASASAGAIGLAGMPYRVRRGLVAMMDLYPDVLAPASVATATVTPLPTQEMASPSTSARPAAEPSFRAPWGEIERELP